MTREIDADFPVKLQFLFRPHRYKIARGGRWSGKSWGFARALLIIGAKRPIRVLCTREVQRSIKDSVHKLLCDQIELLGLQSKYRITDTAITGTEGTEILFSGLLQHTIQSIKSFEGIDICWIEEGQAVSERSLKILIPTIRKAGSEIWITYNPDLETDPVHHRFTNSPPPDCVNVLMNYIDNPWFNELGEMERLHCQQTDPDGYPNIWEGHCRPAVEGAIYYKQIEAAEREGRICNVPYDPLLKAHIVADIGFNDDTALGIFQKNAGELRMIDYIEGNQRLWDDYTAELQAKGYNWGRFWLPHDGHAKRIESRGQSSAFILRRLGWDVPERQETAELSVEEGIKIARQKFPRIYIDVKKCLPFIEHIKRYRRHINQQTETAGAPVHDDHSHAADMLRIFAINEDKMLNTAIKPVRPPARQTQGSWMTL
jgi:phage terminase large subunit